MARRGRPSSPAPASPPDNDDLLSEILRRLPPAPSSLPRASLVCKRWRCIVKDPAFLRRFRARHRHRRGAPLLGFFAKGMRLCGILFTPTLKPPNRLPSGRRGCFSLQFNGVDEWGILGCRHGLVLLLHVKELQVLVWDPVTGDRRRIDVPPGFDTRKRTTVYQGAVLRAASDAHGGSQSSPFQVVLLGYDQGFTRAFVCVTHRRLANGAIPSQLLLLVHECLLCSAPVLLLGVPFTGILLGLRMLSLSLIWKGSA